MSYFGPVEVYPLDMPSQEEWEQWLKILNEKKECDKK